jgi:methylmalonyl-CoA/ethylmalonyl-CoA epimerase
MQNFKFHHLGIATFSAKRTIAFYKELGFQCTEIINDPFQDVNLSFLTKRNHPKIELVEPVSEASPVANILKKNGASLYHICYEVRNLEESIRLLREKKFILITPPIRAVALDNCYICFLFSKEFGLFELVQSKL